LPIAYLTQRPTRRRTNIAIPIPQGLDEGGHRLSIAYRTQRPTRRNTNIAIPIPQGLDEVGHGRRTQFHHRCAHRLMPQRPDQHAPSPLRHHLSHRLRQREGSLTHLLQSRLRYPLPGVRPHAQSRHRLPIPYRT
jgi:hypothetical protein